MRAAKATLASTTCLVSLILSSAALAQSTDELLTAYFDRFAVMAPPDAILEIGPISNGTMAGMRIGEEGDFLMTAESLSFTDVTFGEDGTLETIGELGIVGLSMTSEEIDIAATDLTIGNLGLGQLLVVDGDSLSPNPTFSPFVFMTNPASIIGSVAADNISLETKQEGEQVAVSMASMEASYEGTLLSAAIGATEAVAAPDGDNLTIAMASMTMDSLDIAAIMANPGNMLATMPAGFTLDDFALTFAEAGAPGGIAVVIDDSRLTKSGTDSEGSLETSTTGLRITVDQALMPPEVIAQMGAAAEQLIVDGELVITGETGYNAAWSSSAGTLSLSDLFFTLDNLISLTGGMQLDNVDPVDLFAAMAQGPTTPEQEDALMDLRFSRFELGVENRGLVELAQTNPMFMMAQGMGASGLMQFSAEVTDERVRGILSQLTTFVQNPQSLALTVVGSEQASPRQLDELMANTSGPQDGLPIMLDVFDVTLNVNQ